MWSAASRRLSSALFYRLHVYGRENIPERGPALLVCNHVSYIDFLLLCVAQPRFIRFVFFAGWTKVLFIRHLLRWGRAIPIDATSGPKAILKSLRSAGEALNENDLVCIFAEGRFTRTGFLLPFHRGFEQIVKNNQAPIIPVCLDELWGSIFSFYGDRTLWKLPRRIPYPTSVAFGKPMPATSTAAEVRQAVQQLAADCAVGPIESLPCNSSRIHSHRRPASVPPVHHRTISPECVGRNRIGGCRWLRQCSGQLSNGHWQSQWHPNTGGYTPLPQRTCAGDRFIEAVDSEAP